MSPHSVSNNRWIAWIAPEGLYLVLGRVETSRPAVLNSAPNLRKLRVSGSNHSVESSHFTSLEQTLGVCKRSFISVGVFSGITNLLMLAPAFYMLNIYDKAVGHNSVPTLVVLSIITAVMFVVLGIMESVRSRVLVAVSSRIDKAIAPRLYELSFDVAVRGGGKGATQPLLDLHGLRQFLTGAQIFGFFDAPWLPIYLLVLFMFHPLLGWMGVAAALLFLSLALLNQKRTAPVLQAANKLARENNSDTVQNLRNAEVAASMGMMGELMQRWRVKQDEMLAKQEEASNAAGTFSAVIKTLRLAVQSAAIGAGAYLVLAQEISPGMIIAGSILMSRALQPVEQAVNAWRGFNDAREQYARLDKLLKAWPDQGDRMSLPPITGSLAVQAATIIPPGADKPVVSGATFRVAAGDVCMLIGPSGAGKSSLVKAILGLWPTSEGAIRLDGAETSHYQREQLGPQLGYLPQDIELLNGSVSDNIARFGVVDADCVVQAAKDAGVHEFILSLQEGYETVIGGAGGLLSPGQRQRIALARALYGRPKFVVLDEPNSNLDEAGERALAVAIRTLKSLGSTVIIVSHRKGIMKLVDTLVAVRGGKVLHSGPVADVIEMLKTNTGQSGMEVTRTPSLAAQGHQ